MEGGKAAVCFGSGSAAIAAVLRSVRPGEHIVVPTDVFQGMICILENILKPLKIEYTEVEMTDLSAV